MPEVSEIMTENVFQTAPDATVTDAAAAMVKGRIGSAVVTVGSTVVGIFTERDVLRAVASGGDLTAQPVRRWMTEDPVAADPGLDVGEATALMLTGGFRHLPVLEDGRLRGIVSLRDLLSIRVRGSSDPS